MHPVDLDLDLDLGGWEQIFGPLVLAVAEQLERALDVRLERLRPEFS